MKLRPAQEAILQYQGGQMAISAVPGSGKTFVLTRLAAQLIAAGRLDAKAGQQVLVVTYLNSSVDTFKARIADWLRELGLPLAGFDVRTLHSLAREIVLSDPAAAGVADEFPVLDEGQSTLFLARAVDGWIRDHPAVWHSFLPAEATESPQMRARWRNITEQTAKNWIRLAKNERYLPIGIQVKVDKALNAWATTDEGPPAASNLPLLSMLGGIYARYQSTVEKQGALDFDDLIWRAADLVERNPGLVDALRQRWPFVLEDEAQDSVPLQETLLATLAGPAGNWVRVGDPNQAIMSSFTSSHPRFFRAFLARPEVMERPLPQSGRSSRRIIGLANRLVEWACNEHPLPEVRQAAFSLQFIQPVPADDAQPNPADTESEVRIRVFRHREAEELPAVAKTAWQAASHRPDQTLAILVPTNDAGRSVAEHLDNLGADYDELLRGSAQAQEVAATLGAVLGALANPVQPRSLETALAALIAQEVVPTPNLDPAGRERLMTIVRSVYRPEALLFPAAGEQLSDALPRGVASATDEQIIARFAEQLRSYLNALVLPPDELALALADELFEKETDLAIAYQISGYFRDLMDANPSWRLPELVAELGNVANGSVQLMGLGTNDMGYEPQPGRITLTTQHRAKGMEWDTVFMVGIDSHWIPGHLDARFLGVHDFLGGDPSAEAAAGLRALMSGDAGLLPELSATDTAHIEVIAERLRLLYVGITRARRNLIITRSKAVTTYSREQETGPATAMAALHCFLQEYRG